MMKNGGLLKWTNNKNLSNKNTRNNTKGNKNWLHPPEALQGGHIAYLVKFLGSTEVDQPKGIEVVKEAIRKLRFSQQLKKAEGAKTPKVELTISVDGVAIHQPKTKKNLYQYPLHRISYCADDKAEKRFFSFIAKESDNDAHTCYVFVSDKLAEEITLTIGQAFDLAYRRFLETSSKEIDLRRQIVALQSRVHSLQTENTALKNRLSQVASLKDRVDVEHYMTENGLSDIAFILEPPYENGTSCDPPPLPPPKIFSTDNLPPVPPRNNIKNDPPLIEDLLSSPQPSTDSDDDDEDDFNPRAEESPAPVQLNLNRAAVTNGRCTAESDIASYDDFDFNPRAEEKKLPVQVVDTKRASPIPALLPPPKSSRSQPQHREGSNLLTDPFDTNSVSLSPSTDPLAQFNEMKAGFSRGLSFGTTEDDFTLDSLDPLKN